MEKQKGEKTKYRLAEAAKECLKEHDYELIFQFDQDLIRRKTGNGRVEMPLLIFSAVCD